MGAEVMRMDNPFELAPLDALKAQGAKALRACNDQSAPYGLSLTEEQIRAMIREHRDTLHSAGRIAFDQRPLQDLIRGFCSSPYLTQRTYMETLCELLTIFYYVKNETDNLIPDDDLIACMRKAFDTVCAGTLEYLADYTVEALLRGRGDDWDFKDVDFDE